MRDDSKVNGVRMGAENDLLTILLFVIVAIIVQVVAMSKPRSWGSYPRSAAPTILNHGANFTAPSSNGSE